MIACPRPVPSPPAGLVRQQQLRHRVTWSLLLDQLAEPAQLAILLHVVEITYLFANLRRTRWGAVTLAPCSLLEITYRLYERPRILGRWIVTDAR